VALLAVIATILAVLAALEEVNNGWFSKPTKHGADTACGYAFASSSEHNASS
jgi:hypothetical protein